MTYASEVAADAPVGWYHLDETSGTVAVNSINSAHNGTINGTPVFGAASVYNKLGTSIKFIDHFSTYISLPSAMGWNQAIRGAFSIEFWFRQPLGVRAAVQGFLGGLTGSPSRHDQVVINPDGTLTLRLALVPTAGGTVLDITGTTSARYDDDRWHHVVLTFAQASVGVNLYVDGLAVYGAADTTLYSLRTTTTWWIGYTPGNNFRSEAYVDEVAFYTTALSPARVAAHYEAVAFPVGGATPRTRSLVATPDIVRSDPNSYVDEVVYDLPVDWWRLDEATGPTFVNSVSTARNATVVGTPIIGAESVYADRLGKSVKFVGTSSSYIPLPVGSWSTVNQNEFSLECWFRKPVGTVASTLVSTGDSNNHVYITVYTDGFVRFGSHVSSTSNTTGGFSDTPSLYDDDRWHHAVLTFSSGTTSVLQGYVDGQQIGPPQTFGGAFFIKPTTDWRIGYDASNTVPCYAYVDEVAFYTKALSPARVAAHYDAVSKATLGQGAAQARIRKFSATPAIVNPELNTYAVEVAVDSPEDWWRLDEAAGSTTFVNQIDPSRNGVSVGSPVVGAPSPLGQAFQGTGDTSSYISLPTGPWSTTNLNEFSLECWVRQNYFSTGSNRPILGGLSSINPSVSTVLDVNTSGQFTAELAVTNGTNTFGDFAGGITNFADEKWHHVVSTYSVTTGLIQIFVDGKLDRYDTIGAGYVISRTQSWAVGKHPRFVRPCTASVDEVALYSKALSPARIYAHYIAGIGKSGPIFGTSSRTRSLSGTATQTAPAYLPRVRTLSGTPTATGTDNIMVRTRSLSGTAMAVRFGDEPTYPLVVNTAGTVNVDTTGFNVSQDEVDLGATGTGVFWFRVTAPGRTSITVTDTSPASFMLRAYTVVNPALPLTPDNLSFIKEGTSLDVMASVPVYVMVDVLASAGTVPFTFTYTAAISGAVSLFVVSNSGGSSSVASVPVSPAVLSATVTGTSGITSFDAIFDGEVVLTETFYSGDTWSGAIPVPPKPAGTYDLYIHANGIDVDSSTVAVTIDRTALPATPSPDDDPARIPGTVVGRWAFSDPATGAIYTFPLNPVTAGSTNSPRNHSVDSTTKPTSFVVYEGSLGAKQYTFGGVLLDEEMYQNLAAWSKLNRRVWLVDHNLIAWQVVPQHFDVRPRTHRLNPWIQDYEFTVLLLKGPTLAEVF